LRSAVVTNSGSQAIHAVALGHEETRADTSRLDPGQRVALTAGTFALDTPPKWKTYGDPYEID
jgi:chitosanase